MDPVCIGERANEILKQGSHVLFRMPEDDNSPHAFYPATVTAVLRSGTALLHVPFYAGREVTMTNMNGIPGDQGTLYLSDKTTPTADVLR